MDFILTVVTRAISSNRPCDHNIGEIRSNQSMITGETIVKKSNQNLPLVLNFKSKQLLLFQIQKQTVPVSDDSELPLATSSTFIPGNKITLQALKNYSK